MPFGDTVTVLRRPARSKFGDEAFDEHHTISGVGIDWAATDEPNSSNSNADNNREAVLTDVVLYCPWGVDVLSSDRIELPDGDVYRVMGKPLPGNSPLTGWKPGVLVKLQRIEG